MRGCTTLSLSELETLFILALIFATLGYLLISWDFDLDLETTSSVPDKPSPEIDYFKLAKCPLPRPLEGFDIDRARARPYRPFRWRYHQTMGTAALFNILPSKLTDAFISLPDSSRWQSAMWPLESDWWIELESTYRDRIAQRQELYRKHGRAIVDALPDSEDACREMVYMVIQFLCARYPAVFQLRKVEFGGKSAGYRFSNGILGTETDVEAVEPLIFLLDNVPEDFLVIQKDEEKGGYVLKAGVSCSAIGWSMGEKMGKHINDIHEPVPDYAEQLKTSLNRYFENMDVEKPIQRGSWSFEVGQPLFLKPNSPEYIAHKTLNPNLKVEDIHLRVDWQTLRRLPQSKAIVFNFKALFTPVTQFQDEPFIPQLVAKVLSSGKPAFKEYKGWGCLEHKLLPALNQWAEYQVAKGMIPKGWEERTLEDQPFYPGWRGKYKYE